MHDDDLIPVVSDMDRLSGAAHNEVNKQQPPFGVLGPVRRYLVRYLVRLLLNAEVDILL